MTDLVTKEHRGILLGMIQIEGTAFNLVPEDTVSMARMCSEVVTKSAAGFRCTGISGRNDLLIGKVETGFMGVQVVVTPESIQLHCEEYMVSNQKVSDLCVAVSLPETQGHLVIIGRCQKKAQRVALVMDLFSDQIANEIIHAIVQVKRRSAQSSRQQGTMLQTSTVQQRFPTPSATLMTSAVQQRFPSPVTPVLTSTVQQRFSSPTAPVMTSTARQRLPSPASISAVQQRFPSPPAPVSISPVRQRFPSQAPPVSISPVRQRFPSPAPPVSISPVGQRFPLPAPPVSISPAQYRFTSPPAPVSISSPAPRVSISPVRQRFPSQAPPVSISPVGQRFPLPAPPVSISPAQYRFTSPPAPVSISSPAPRASISPVRQRFPSQAPPVSISPVGQRFPLPAPPVSISPAQYRFTSPPAPVSIPPVRQRFPSPAPPVSISPVQHRFPSPPALVSISAPRQGLPSPAAPASISTVQQRFPSQEAPVMTSTAQQSLPPSSAPILRFNLRQRSSSSSTPVSGSVVIVNPVNVNNLEPEVTTAPSQSTAETNVFSQQLQSKDPTRRFSIAFPVSGQFNTISTPSSSSSTSISSNQPVHFQPVFGHPRLRSSTEISNEQHSAELYPLRQPLTRVQRPLSMVELYDLNNYTENAGTMPYQPQEPLTAPIQPSQRHSPNETIPAARPSILPKPKSITEKEERLPKMPSFPKAIKLRGISNKFKDGFDKLKDIPEKVNRNFVSNANDVAINNRNNTEGNIPNTAKFPRPEIHHCVPLQNNIASSTTAEINDSDNNSEFSDEEETHSGLVIHAQDKSSQSLTNDIISFLTNEYEYLGTLERISKARSLLSPKMQILLRSAETLYEIHGRIYCELYANMESCTKIARVFISYKEELEVYKYYMMNSPEICSYLQDLPETIIGTHPKLGDDIKTSWKRLHYYHMNLDKMLSLVEEEDKPVISEAVDMLKNLNLQADAGILLDSVKGVPYSLHLRAPLLLHQTFKITGPGLVKGKPYYVLLFTDVIAVTYSKGDMYQYQRDIHLEQANFISCEQEHKFSLEVDTGGSRDKLVFTFKSSEKVIKDLWCKEINKLKQEQAKKVRTERNKRYGIQVGV